MPLVTRYPSGVPGPTGPPGPPGASIVTDGVTTVDPATTIDFTSGATVTDGGAGVARVAISGGGAGGVVVRGPFAFDFSQAVALAAGVQVYVPIPGDILLNAWIEVTTAFDGTSPGADIGTITAGAWTNPGSWFNQGNGLIALGTAWGSSFATDVLSQQFSPGFDDFLGAAVASGSAGMFPPARFLTANPVVLAASQNASTIGATPLDSTQGAGNVYLVTATPVALP